VYVCLFGIGAAIGYVSNIDINLKINIYLSVIGGVICAYSYSKSMKRLLEPSVIDIIVTIATGLLFGNLMLLA
jgi:hypothetical protein